MFYLSVDRLDGVILWALFLLFLFYLYRLVKRGEDVPIDEVEELDEKDTLFRLGLMIILGIAAIVVGSNMTINSATYIAKEIGISQRLIGLTIIAFGTSLPELVTSMTAAWKGKSDLAIGNIIGSNIFNILFVLGTTALISPAPIIGALFLLYTFIDNRYCLKKSGAVIMLIGYIAYFISVL